MNKRADITINILVIGIFAVCSFALLTFFLNAPNVFLNVGAFSGNAQDFTGVGLVEKVNIDFQELSANRSVNIIKIGNESKGEFISQDRRVAPFAKAQRILFEVKYFLPKE